MLESSVQPILVDVTCHVLGHGLDFGDGISHGDGVGGEGDHFAVVYAVADGVDIVFGDIEAVHEPLDAGGFGVALRDGFDDGAVIDEVEGVFEGFVAGGEVFFAADIGGELVYGVGRSQGVHGPRVLGQLIPEVFHIGVSAEIFYIEEVQVSSFEDDRHAVGGEKVHRFFCLFVGNGLFVEDFPVHLDVAAAGTDDSGPGEVFDAVAVDVGARAAGAYENPVPLCERGPDGLFGRIRDDPLMVPKRHIDVAEDIFRRICHTKILSG